MYKVLICGNVEWHKFGPIKRELRRLIKKHGKDKLLIIEGGAPGADIMSKIVAEELSVHVAEIKALWGTRYRSAGPQRNDAMLALDPNEVIAFAEDMGPDRGTHDTITKAHKRGIKNKVVKS